MVIRLPFILVRNDITMMRVDAIVNAANSSLRGGGGVDGAIHRAAGPGLLEKCKALGGCKVGEAKITGGFDLHAKFVIHTVGPKWRGGVFGEKRKLASCYENSLRLALEYGCETVAFPLISSGTYKFPKKDALNIAVDTIRAFLDEHEMTVYLVVFDKESVAFGEEKYPGLRQFIDDRYSESSYIDRRRTDDAEESVVICSVPDVMTPLSSAESDVVYDAMRLPSAPSTTAPRGIPTGASYPTDNYGKKEKKNEPKEKKVKEKRSRSEKHGTVVSPPGSSAPFSSGYGASFGEQNTAKPINEPIVTKSLRRSSDLDATISGSSAQSTQFDFPAPYGGEPLNAPNSSGYPKTGRPGDGRVASIDDESCKTDKGVHYSQKPTITLEEKLKMLDESFSQMLLRKIDESGMTDAECYKKANIDRKLFNKIKNDPNYRPSKPTVLAFAVALSMNIYDARDFLARAGFAFSGASKFDIIIEYFITIGVYDIFEINMVLFKHDQCLLGNVA